jgi:hypothetical protein
VVVGIDDGGFVAFGELRTLIGSVRKSRDVGVRGWNLRSDYYVGSVRKSRDVGVRGWNSRSDYYVIVFFCILDDIKGTYPARVLVAGLRVVRSSRFRFHRADGEVGKRERIHLPFTID